MATPSLSFQNFYTTALTSDITSSATDIFLDTVPNGTEGFLVIEPDSTTAREIIYYTSKSATKVICPSALAGRGLDDTSAGSHLAGVVVIMAPIAAFFEALQDGTGLALTTIKITTAITDTNGNETIKFGATTSAVNEITVTNGATGDPPLVAASGETNVGLDLSSKGTGSVKLWSGNKARELLILPDVASAVNEVTITGGATGVTGPSILPSGETNIDLRIGGKGTGGLHHITGSYGDITADSDGATITFNCATSNVHKVTLGGNRTLALSNDKVGQVIILRLLQDGTGSRTVTWFSTIKWAGGTPPTLTATADKADVLGLVVTGSGTYDGFVIGQNL